MIKSFYPTPKTLIDKMLSGLNLSNIESVLEPSAGKGDLADAIKEKLAIAKARAYYRSEYKADIDTIELDQNLQHILKGKGYRVVHDDFLTFSTYKTYHLIIMNPPFDTADKHFIKAYSMIENGGNIICVMNAETLKNPFSLNRQKVLDIINKHHATVEYLNDEFSTAERKTNVEIALIKLHVPTTPRKSIILESLKKANPIKEITEEQYKSLAENDFIKATVRKYNIEVEAGIQLIRDYNALRPMLLKSFDAGASEILNLTMHGDQYHTVTENEYIEETRKKYWSALILSPQFSKSLTSNLIDKYYKGIENLKGYDFSEYNIKTIRQDLMEDYISSVEETIINLFEDLSNKYHWYDETSKNAHYFDGWATNKAWIINKKVILPLGLYGYLNRDASLYDYKVKDKISDIDKTLRYLSWDKEPTKDVMETLEKARENNQTKNIEFDYFTITCYKKGTTHITFTDLELLKKLNYFGCQKKNWLPPAYGKKTYKNMTPKEKHVIDSLEGEKEYNNTMENPRYYLSGAQIALE